MSDNEAAIERIAKDIFMSDNSNAADPEKEWENALAADRGYARHIARGLHSLGYTHSIVHDCCVEAEAAKLTPRTIDDVGQMKALKMADLVLAHNGTPRHRLFEYPHRDDDSRRMIQEAEAVVSAILTVLHEPAQ